ncbi:hypothetical protein N7475_007862 [Penicillium sp. IBT 31633x]|nr:hypothetical protein N7475_007862 [Penicillium sp. IBT 31633x]
MERKLSTKATKMRHRLTFTRSSSTRSRSTTMVSPIVTSLPSPRVRSASSPESPTHDGPTWDSIDANANRGYTFTDEEGYFRPASPFIDRQEIEEDLEADIKHACALLSHSIDRGIPAGLSYQSAVPNWTDGKQPVGQPSGDVSLSFLDQHILFLQAPKPNNRQTESSKKHDSGVDMSFHTPSQHGISHANSVPGTDATGRFYNQPPPSHHHTAHHHQHHPDPHAPGARRSYSASSAIFPYSPPLSSEENCNSTRLSSPVSQLNETDKELTTASCTPKANPKHTHKSAPKSHTSTPTVSSEPSLGEPGQNWLRASKNIQRLIEEEKANAARAKRAKPSGRFYSSASNQRTSSFDSREWLAKNFWEDRDPSLYGDASSMYAGVGTASRSGTTTPRLGSFSTNGEELPGLGGYPYQAWAGPSGGMSYSSSCLGDEFKHQENVFSAAVPSEPRKFNRRKKASLLLRKLAGLGLRRKGQRGGNGGR